jgi:hypothetical protein
MADLGNQKSPAEIRVRLLLWVVQHLADQFGVRANDIVTHFDLVLSRSKKEKQRTDSLDDDFED